MESEIIAQLHEALRTRPAERRALRELAAIMKQVAPTLAHTKAMVATRPNSDGLAAQLYSMGQLLIRAGQLSETIALTAVPASSHQLREVAGVDC